MNKIEPTLEQIKAQQEWERTVIPLAEKFLQSRQKNDFLKLQEAIRQRPKYPNPRTFRPEAFLSVRPSDEFMDLIWGVGRALPDEMKPTFSTIKEQS